MLFGGSFDGDAVKPSLAPGTGLVALPMGPGRG